MGLILQIVLQSALTSVPWLLGGAIALYAVFRTRYVQTMVSNFQRESHASSDAELDAMRRELSELGERVDFLERLLIDTRQPVEMGGGLTRIQERGRAAHDAGVSGFDEDP